MLWIMIGSIRRDILDNGGYVDLDGFRSFDNWEVVR